MKLVPVAVSKTVARTALKANKNAPSILFVAGVTGVVATTVLACRATLKLDPVIEDTQKRLEDVRFKHESVDNEVEVSRQYRKDLTMVYLSQVGEVAKLYAPAIVVGSLSIAALTKSHNMLTSRNAALVAAYTTLQQGFDEYRQRVRDEFGEDKEREIRYAGEMVDIEREGKNGPKKTKEMRVGERSESVYARFFDPTNENWSPLPEYNIMFIRLQQNWLNDKLRARGHVLLNDAYDVLGLPRTHEGTVVGWMWDSEHGDQYIDFGCFDSPDRDGFYEYLVAKDGSLLLDFNVDGVINNLL